MIFVELLIGVVQTENKFNNRNILTYPASSAKLHFMSIIKRLGASTLEYIRRMGVMGLFLFKAVLFIVIRREEATEEIGERFRHLAEHMSEGFIFVSSDGTVVLVNKALSELTGIAERDLIGKNAREMAEEFNLEPVLTQIDHHAKGVLVFLGLSGMGV